MRDASIAVLREIGVETGGSNVQFAVNPADGRMVVIEMNPRVSRSSALASKATGFPIAKVAAKLAVGYTLDEIANDHHRRRDAGVVRADDRLHRHQDPALRLQEKFPGAEPTLTTAMKSVGRSDGDRPHLPGIAAEGRCARSRPASTGSTRSKSTDWASVTTTTCCAPRSASRRPDRLLKVAQAMRLGDGESKRSTSAARSTPGSSSGSPRSCRARRQGARAWPGRLTLAIWRALKASGFSDARLAALAGKAEADVAAARRTGSAFQPVFKRMRHLRRGVRLAHGLHVFDLRGSVRRQGEMRSRPLGAREDRHPRRRPY